MDTTGPVAVAVDGTERSDPALEHAVREAQARRVPLRLVHVEPVAMPGGVAVPLYPPIDLAGIGRRALADAASRADDLSPGLDVERVLRRGGRVREIVAAADGCQLLVVGRETHHGIDRLLLGTTTAGVAARAECPIHVVPTAGDESRPTATTTGPVVVGVESTDQRGLLDRAADLALAAGVPLTVVHAWHVPAAYGELTAGLPDPGLSLRDAFASALAALTAAKPELEVTLVVEMGDAPRILGRTAAGASRLVLERPQHHLWPGHLGRTSRHVLHTCPSLVEIVPSRWLAGAEPVVDGELERDGDLVR